MKRRLTDLKMFGPFYFGGDGGGGSYSPTYRNVKRDFYVHTILSADETIEHWEEAVEAGKSILWDALSAKINEVTLRQIDEYPKMLEEIQNRINRDLDAQFERIRSGKEAVVAEANGIKYDIGTIATGLSSVQKAVLGEVDDAV